MERKYKRYFLNVGLFMVISSILFSSCYIVYNIAIDKKEEIFVENYNYDNYKVNEYDKNKEYYAILEIPKLNLKKGFYDINNKKNNVNENITILEGSTMPNSDNSYLALAAHSGNSNVGYFKNLDKLQEKDIVKIHYSNKIYLYQVYNIYEEEKNGQISFSMDNRQELILTTCSKNKNKQLVITSFLQKIENI